MTVSQLLQIVAYLVLGLFALGILQMILSAFGGRAVDRSQSRDQERQLELDVRRRARVRRTLGWILTVIGTLLGGIILFGWLSGVSEMRGEFDFILALGIFSVPPVLMGVILIVSASKRRVEAAARSGADGGLRPGTLKKGCAWGLIGLGALFMTLFAVSPPPDVTSSSDLFGGILCFAILPLIGLVILFRARKQAAAARDAEAKRVMIEQFKRKAGDR